jgi:hypothetical protein
MPRAISRLFARYFVTIPLLFSHYLEPVVGIEPTTDGLQNRCSTAELNWLPKTRLFTTPPPI